jgi:hypothetical protein
MGCLAQFVHDPAAASRGERENRTVNAVSEACGKM